MKKNITISFTILFVLFTFLLPLKTGAVEDIQVEVQPRRISTRASYQLLFKLEKPLEIHDWIKIIWPKGTQLPVLPENKSQRNAELKRIVESIYIGTSPCSACQGLPVIDYRENSIRFNIHLELDPANPGYEYVFVHVTDRVGIVNPPDPGQYEIKIQTAKETSTATSIPYEIVESHIGVPTGTPIVTVDPSGINYKAAYQITFTTGTGGELFMNRSRIRITFPEGTTLLKTNREIPLTAISINGNILSQQPMVVDSTITLLAPMYIGNSETVTLSFSKEVGIINPAKPDQYTIEVSTSEDPDLVLSEPYMIRKENPALEITPPTTNKIASYRFSFVSDQDIGSQYPIYIQFPPSMKMPSYIKKTAVLLNQTEVFSIAVRDHLLMVNPAQMYEVGKTIELYIGPEAGIHNPSSPEDVFLSYKWKDTAPWETTQKVPIQDPTIVFIKAEVLPPNAEEIASFIFTILNGATSLHKGDQILLQFPVGTIIPKDVSPTSLTILGQSPPSVASHLHSIELTIPMEIEPEKTCIIHCKKEAGIRTPSHGNQMIQFGIQTPYEKEFVLSPELYLYPPIPTAELNLIEGVKGNFDWYQSPPKLNFNANQKEAEILFWFDQETETQIFHKPLPLEMGQYTTTLYFFAQNSYQKGELQSTLIKIDTIAPELIVINPMQPTTYTNQETSLINGRILTLGLDSKKQKLPSMDISRLLINNQIVPVEKEEMTDSYSFSLLVPLQEGENEIIVKAEDEAGNTTIRPYHIIKDTVPPGIKIDFPTAVHPSFTKSFQIQGTTEPFTELYLNRELIFVDETGTFSYPFRVDKVGSFSLSARAIDKSGNEMEQTLILWAGVTIQLKIGSTTATRNNDPTSLDESPPFIHTGRTMVPFRYIGEALEATISFKTDPVSKQVVQVAYQKNTTTITLLINKTKAYVNERPFVLDVPPQIIKGRTMVPLRFISEQLGAHVDWNAQEQVIGIQYPVW